MTIEKKTKIHGFPTGNFLVRSHHSRSLHHGRRLLQVNVDDRTRTAELAAWVDESKGELQEGNIFRMGSNVSYVVTPTVADERLEDHDNQVFYMDEDGRLHSKASPSEHVVHWRFDRDLLPFVTVASTMNFELVLQSPQQQSGRACQFSYNRESKIIAVSAPLADEISDSGSDGASPVSPMSERSFPELVQQEFVLELIPQRHNSNVARFWNYYVNPHEGEERRQQDNEKETAAFSNDLVTDSSRHRRRDVRLAKNMNGCNLPQNNMFQQWDIIPLR
ncbi:hypothetical protein FRC12_024865 [Ceratobasidium sp. 428]|nr:hypothetical protein FRC12_024865 [Ceratobasidium sp. 428]